MTRATGTTFPAIAPDPLERLLPLVLKLILYGFLTLLLLQAIEVFAEYRPGVPWPRLLWIIRTFIFLPLHEGGHFISIPFGRTFYVLGGSFWQITFPLLWCLIAIGQKSQVAPFPLFWVGENMMDVSLYIRDAPVRALPLLGGHKSGHDWYYLLSRWDMMDSAETLADVFYDLGILLCVLAILAGIAWAILFYRRPGSSPGALVAFNARVDPAAQKRQPY
jgi:hypothetical protein